MSMTGVTADRRDPANELYDRACDLLLAAQGLRAAAAERGSATAIAAALGCIDASLAAIAHGIAGMRREATSELARSVSGAAVETARMDFAELADALDAAQRAADSVRERMGPALAQLTLA